MIILYLYKQKFSRKFRFLSFNKFVRSKIIKMSECRCTDHDVHRYKWNVVHAMIYK